MLEGKSFAFLAAAGFDEEHLITIQKALVQHGAQVKILSVSTGLINGWTGRDWGLYFPVDQTLAEVMGSDYDALFIPGGLRSVSKLSESAHCRRLANHFLSAGKPIAAYNEGVSLLLESTVIEGIELSVPDSYADLAREHGAHVQDAAVHIDINIVTGDGRDEKAFVDATIKTFCSEMAWSHNADAA